MHIFQQRFLWITLFLLAFGTQAQAQFGIRFETYGVVVEDIQYRAILNTFANVVVGPNASPFGAHFLGRIEYTGFSTDAEDVTRLALTSSLRLEVGFKADTGTVARSFSSLILGLEPIIRFGKQHYADLYLDLIVGINAKWEGEYGIYPLLGFGAGFRIDTGPILIDSKLAFRSTSGITFLGEISISYQVLPGFRIGFGLWNYSTLQLGSGG
jgi:hypothetical protein